MKTVPAYMSEKYRVPLIYADCPSTIVTLSESTFIPSSSPTPLDKDFSLSKSLLPFFSSPSIMESERAKSSSISPVSSISSTELSRQSLSSYEIAKESPKLESSKSISEAKENGMIIKDMNKILKIIKILESFIFFFST